MIMMITDRPRPDQKQHKNWLNQKNKIIKKNKTKKTTTTAIQRFKKNIITNMQQHHEHKHA